MNTSFSVKKFISNIERDLMFYLILNTKRGRWTYEKAKTLAADFMFIRNKRTLEDFLAGLSEMTTIHPEIQDIYLRYAREYYEYSTAEKITQMRRHTQLCEYDRALEAAAQCCNLNQTLGRRDDGLQS